MKKIVLLVFVLIFALGASVGCAENTRYENITYRENGIEFFLPTSMRRENASGYDFYFSNLTTSMIFTAVKIDSEILAELGIDEGVTAAEYVDIIIEKNQMDKDKLYYSYDEKRDHYNFRYTFVDEDEYEVFYYIVVTGAPDNLWYIEMCCEQEDSATHLSAFETWRKNIKTYEE